LEARHLIEPIDPLSVADPQLELEAIEHDPLGLGWVKVGLENLEE
jgi:hypothetical protein